MACGLLRAMWSEKKSVTVHCELLCGGNGTGKLRERVNCGSVLWNFWICHRDAVSGVRENNIQVLLIDESKAEWEATAKAGHGPWAAPGSSFGVSVWNSQTHHKLAAFSSLPEVGPEQPELEVWMWLLVCFFVQLHCRASSLDPGAWNLCHVPCWVLPVKIICSRTQFRTFLAQFGWCLAHSLPIAN